jgi:hypothetical protein
MTGLKARFAEDVMIAGGLELESSVEDRRARVFDVRAGSALTLYVVITPPLLTVPLLLREEAVGISRREEGMAWEWW